MSKTDSFEWKKFLIEGLGSTNFCCLASVDAKGVWSNPVFFAWDSQFNIYFISQMKSRHMQNISKDPRVSLSIYNTNQKEHVIGIQAEGSAQILTEDSEIKNAFDIYYNRAGKGSDVLSYINNPIWIFVKVVPNQIYYFDTRFFDEERQAVPWQALKD